MRRALLAVVGLALAVVGVIAIPSSSSTPASATSLFRLAETNGNYAVGWGNSGVGNAVKEISGGYRLNFHATTTYQNLAAGTIAFTNGLYMATTADCTGVIQKGSASDNGTVWAEYFSNGSVYMVNRYCDGHIADHPGDITLAGFNSGREYTVCGPPFNCSGFLRAMSFR